MFERYTERARRVIFFARYEASQAGSLYITTDHLVLGMIRESASSIKQHLQVDLSELEKRLTSKPPSGAKIATSVDLPLDKPSKRALAYAAEEAERLGHKFIGTEHLLLGVMREENSETAQRLKTLGAPSIDQVRRSMVESGPERSTRSDLPALGVPSWVRFIEPDTGRELTARLGYETVPRIGEAVTLAMEPGVRELFRVVDVNWNFHTRSRSDDLILITIEIRIRREESASSTQA